MEKILIFENFHKAPNYEKIVKKYILIFQNKTDIINTRMYVVVCKTLAYNCELYLIIFELMNFYKIF